MLGFFVHIQNDSPLVIERAIVLIVDQSSVALRAEQSAHSAGLIRLLIQLLFNRFCIGFATQ